MKGNGEEGRWGRWQVVRKGSSEVVYVLGRKAEYETSCFSV